MANRELSEIKVGDTVDFKYDIEGTATVLAIETERGLFGDITRTFIVGHPGKSHEPWHIMSRSHPKFGAVVYIESYNIYAVNGEWV